MGLPAEKMRRATYADLEAVPANKVAELIRGMLHVMPRPAPKHANTSSALGFEIGARHRLPAILVMGPVPPWARRTRGLVDPG